MAGPEPAAAGVRINRSHAIALYGEPKYGPDFRHFSYVNPDAPVGGLLRLGATGTFDSFNPYIIRGNPAAGIAAESLTVASADELFTRYGLIAETIEWPDDRSWVAFTLRPEARWHDGKPITADDVVFSFETLKGKGQPFFRFYYASVSAVEAIASNRVMFRFSEKGNRELPLIVGEMPILPKHYWQERDFERSTLEPPLGSGPFRIASFDTGRNVVAERVADYWGAALPVNVGQNNFQQIRYDYFRDDTVLRQALKADVIDLRIENQAKAWALDYDVPAVTKGWLIKEAIPHHRPAPFQAWAMNNRRAPFTDLRVRQALGFAFDFQWSNRVLFFDQYERSTSYFPNSILASSGLPDGEELAILEPHRARLPAELFTTPFTLPITDGSGWPRDNLLTALDLLGQAGWHVGDDLHLHRDGDGLAMTFEILLVSPAIERIALPFVRNLKRIGIEARVRLVDETQYINRLRDFDFDMVMAVWGQSNSPGNEQRSYWGSRAADLPGSRNLAGIADPVVDDLIDQVVTAPSRESLIAHTRALDRVLLWGFHVIPAWYSDRDRYIFWDRFSRPEVTPADGTSIDFWWFDAAKAARLDRRADRASRRPDNDGRSRA